MTARDRMLLMSPKAVMHVLNAADKDAPPIENVETIRRWKREGFPWLTDD